MNIEEVSEERSAPSGTETVSRRIHDDKFKYRCRTFLKRRQCPRGSACKYLHECPKQDNIVCKFFLEGTCTRSIETCVFKHDAEGLEYISRVDNGPIVGEPEESHDIIHSLGRILNHLRNLYESDEER